MRSTNSATLWISLLASLACASSATAQSSDPDIRDIQPFVMVMVDSSGSMESRPDCECVTLGCTECLPDCTLNNVGTEPPAGKKNRWATLLEALTGKFNDFQCTKLARTAANGMTGYDNNYPIPYHQPWKCASGLACPYPGPSAQQTNGLLDNYLTRLRFGLMTFDGRKTYGGAPDLVAADTFLLNLSLSEGEEGSWSYGGPKRIHYPTCTTDYMEDWGVRGPGATEGGMISMNWAGCTSPPCDIYKTNEAIQDSLLRTRSFGGTPIAAALDDLYYHFKTDTTDPYASCRGRYAVLITDGYPDDDYRAYPTPGCDCARAPYNDCPTGTVVADMKCPYPTANQAAYDLIHGRSGDSAQMQQLFVVGMSVNDSGAKALLNSVASNGGSLDTDGDGNEAFFASDPTKLTATLDTLFGGLSKPVSRSVPAFATGLKGAQYQISAGFQLSNDRPVAGVAAPWTGIIERRRFQCDGANLTSLSLDSSAGDKFQDVVNGQTTRTLWTALPSTGTISSARLNGALYRGSTAADCGTTYCNQPNLTDSSVTPTWLGVSTAADKTRITDWMYGVSGSVRENKRLGDVYHSSPTVVGPPMDDPGDGSYTLFQDQPVITERPLVMYVGTNDGILHAFSVEDYPATSVTLTVHASAHYRAGEEMWGFVPPLMLDNLNDQISSHQLSMDGTPVVKDVYFSKSATANAANYHSVLITGMRGGGNAYIALDVTDPVVPKFLWQFTDTDMGKTYGQPEIVQAFYEWPAGSAPSYRAMAILPGGRGTRGVGGPGCNGTTTSSMRVVGSQGTSYKTWQSPLAAGTQLQHRSDVQCWAQQGRALYFVDVETGQLIKKIFDTDTTTSNGILFPSPITGSPTAYQDAVGTLATEGFVMDADGLLWRIDLTASDPHKDDALAGWTVRPFHDLFWGTDPTSGETTYERPILSMDQERRLVIIVGTGDTDAFDKPLIKNRIVSLTEMATVDQPTTPDQFVAAMNWEERVDGANDFVTSELVTGSMALFGGQLYVASFVSVVDNSNACDSGRGRLWAFDYIAHDPNDVNTTSGGLTYGPLWLTKPTGGYASNSADSGANLLNVDVAHAEPNLLIQGLGATQRLSCQATATDLSNYFSHTGGLLDIRQSSPPAIWIVAQASSNNANRKRAGSLLGSLEMETIRPQSFSRVMSWTQSID